MEMMEIMILLILLIMMNLNLYLVSLFMYMISLMYLFKLSWIDWFYQMFNFGFNYYSMGMLIMTFWLGGLILMNLMNEHYLNIYLNIIMFMIMLINFFSMNLLVYYFMFEISLLLIFIIIMNWGFSVDRILSSFYLMFYTMVFSLPTLLILFTLLNLNKSLDFIMLEFYGNNLMNLLMIYLMMVFLIKVPMYMFHSWLLKAHVEAPFYSSMILASIMLKLGGYGLIRLFNMFKYLYNFMYYFIVISFMGMLMLSLMCLIQLDMKILVAISSVVHMMLMLVGLFTFMKVGFLGSYLMMISHGFSSSGLFYLINIIYVNSNSRLMFINKGMIIFMPSMSLMWFLLCSLNMAVPLTLNLISEIMLFISIIYFMKFMIIFMMMYCLFSFLYSLYLFSYIQHGFSLNLKNIFSGSIFNYFILLMHWLPMNLLILNLNFII
uniref:NADH-ubiquinone oxidoreductase chain 4 n=1 Tax=Ceratina okinawana TaxID=236018 RepID=A0A7U0R6A4_9HYME|nr:NADH dehydrogenase subunit 4 [Ceratina okinawana]QQX27994.1 NADH dehydrogenase subunit 4 [Ceratina okinawana]